MMIAPGAVAFDIDGVVADTMRLFLDIARREFKITHLRYADITDYDLRRCLGLSEEVVGAVARHIFDGSYVAPLEPVAGAAEVLKQLSRACAPVLFITARPYPGPMAEWIETAIGIDRSRAEIIATGSFEAKAEILLARKVEWFVEDRLETCFLLSQAGIKPIVFAQPWNRKSHNFVEVDGWPALKELIVF